GMLVKNNSRITLKDIVVIVQNIYSPDANRHLKLQIALTWTNEVITLLTNTIWLVLSALLGLDIP
ncbi:MAG: hypothetical protein PHS23_05760, partial [Candidatus Cloacimonetes bacterium]|nr:hypothetical protein [Candidatus Cloacimonadota bacterium]